MRTLSLIGSGYAGIATAISFIENGYNTICVDIDEKKVESINKGINPFYDPGINERVEKYAKNKKLRATTDLKEAILNSDASFICVGTPSKEDGGIDLKYIKEASKSIGKVLRYNKKYHVVAVKSTVIPGTTKDIVLPLLEKYSKKKAGKSYGVCMNPEFLREGNAYYDSINPDKIVIGQLDKKSGDVLRKIYSNFESVKKNPEILITTDLTTAEMIKYANNALLATKISFSNEIGNLCKKFGIDTYEVMKMVGMDNRLSPKFLASGIGFGGSCFPKDLEALRAIYADLNEDSDILDAVLEVNRKQPHKAVDLVNKYDPEVVAVLGLSFKPDTDDVRKTRVAAIIDRLLDEGKEVVAWDPFAIETFKKDYPELAYKIILENNLKRAVKNVDAIIIATEHSELKNFKFPDIPIIEGRRVFKNKKPNVEGICW
ncbi:MAG: UDP-glucose/GDP-mannose dehydrogenase family protein [Candidatus Woesearchaeota archaeon]|nr:MAG: UDP-glucose/GDP-mannose dehydrogenase family protein [Candidatus Woesearchaeota archaeon]